MSTKHKTADLEGPLLDAAVALAEGIHPYNFRNKWCLIVDEQKDETVVYEPSLDWELGGPIIERERIQLLTNDDGTWRAGTWALECLPLVDSPPYIFANEQHGPTPLVAAMRAFVREKLGEMVELF